MKGFLKLYEASGHLTYYDYERQLSFSVPVKRSFWLQRRFTKKDKPKVVLFLESELRKGDLLPSRCSLISSNLEIIKIKSQFSLILFLSGLTGMSTYEL